MRGCKFQPLLDVSEQPLGAQGRDRTQDFTGTSLKFPREIPLDEAGRFPCLSTIPVQLPALGISRSRILFSAPKRDLWI